MIKENFVDILDAVFLHLDDHLTLQSFESAHLKLINCLKGAAYFFGEDITSVRHDQTFWTSWDQLNISL